VLIDSVTIMAHPSVIASQSFNSRILTFDALTNSV
jgi:hypothetical protein